jgi:hypothetical protein
LLAIGGLTVIAWRLRSRSDADRGAWLFWAAAVACVITSPTGWVMGMVLALPLAPLAAEGGVPRGPTVAVAAAWIAVALPAPFAGWAALAGAALIVAAIVAAVVAANTAAGALPPPGVPR